MTQQSGRREFLKILGAGSGAMGAAALASAPSMIHPEAPVPAPPQQQIDWQEMDRLHQVAVQTFLGNIGKDPTFWPQPLDFTMDGDVKVFELTCSDIQWDTGGGTTFPAFAYNGTVPGPEIRFTEGDRVRVIVHNQMSQSTAIHWHGLLVPNNMDGVPYVTQPPIEPGQDYTYEFTARNSGSHIYHSHHNALEQVVRGLFGPLVVEPLVTTHEPHVDREYTMVLNDTFLGFTINGRGFPYTQPLVAAQGERIRIRYMNEGLMIHPMHLHGIPQLVFAKDGYYLPAPYLVDTLNVAPGERYDVVVDCTEVGLWAFHCHILSHAESAQGMFGMVTVLKVDPA